MTEAMTKKQDFDEGFDAGWMSCLMTLRIALRRRITIGEAIKELDPIEVIYEMKRLKA
jgi:hypothetical protein